MKAFLCSSGVISTCDMPKLTGSAIEIARQLGFELVDYVVGPDGELRCGVCRPPHDQDVFLTIHGLERNIYALVVWEQRDSATFIFVPTPFDLVTAVEYVARYERALHDAQHYLRLRTEEVTVG
jgi:hypothetical protein